MFGRPAWWFNIACRRHALEDKDWIKYKSLKKDKSLKSINPSDLPSDFCQKACDLVDEFRKKTVNLKEEWMF